MSLSFNALLSTEQSRLRQNINKFSLFLKPEKLLKDRLKIPKSIFNIKGIHFGTSYPQFSELTLYSVPVNGVLVDLSLFGFRFAFTNGNMKKSIPYSDTVYGSYKRDVVSLRTGFGSDDGTHILFSFLHSYDIINSIPEYYFPSDDSDSVIATTPQENYVLGGDIGILIRNFSLKGEFAFSQVTRDKRIPSVNVYKIPEWVFNLFKPNMSSSFDYAYSLKSDFSFKSTSLSFEYRFIGPGFKTFGNPELLSDRYGFNINLTQDLFSYLSILFGFKNEKNNIGFSNHTNFSYFIYQIGFTHPEIPYLNISFKPFREKNDSMGIDKKSNDLIISTGQFFRI